MPLSSGFTRLKSCLRRKIHPKPATQVRDETAEISKSCAGVCSTVTLAMHNVINAQAGASTTAAAAHCTADRISTRLNSLTNCVNIITSGIGYELSLGHRRSTDLGRLQVVLDFLVRNTDRNARLFAGHVAYYSKANFDSPQGKATCTAIVNAQKDITYAVADAVMAHTDVVKPTIASIRFIEKLTLAVTTEASQAARTAAEAATPNDPPPPYTL
ncbi:hypothetical protein F4819DRAFT_491499 [Hypoxylon fuscum]|nr:hypothetical protein F4819DRAFT_491499 [Hypoxylon fuscum]